jgi:uncharacterized protein (DUF302 family)
MLPCNVILQEKDDGEVEIAAVNPVESMKAIDNPDLKKIAETIGEKLQIAVQKA